MIKNRTNIILFLFIVMMMTACGEEDQTTAKNDKNDSGDLTDINFTWGSASAGSDSFVMIEALASTANNYVDFSNSSISTSGSIENTVLVSQGEIEIGSSTSDTLFNASNNNEPFEDEDINITQLFSFVYWTVPIITPLDSGIESFDDLEGHRIGIGLSGQSSSSIMLETLEKYDMEDSVDIEYIDGDDAADALAAGQLDATTVSHLLGKNVTPAFQQLAQTIEFKPVEIDESVLKEIVDANSGLIITETSAETMDFYTKDILSVGTTGILIANPDADEDAIYELTKAVLENEEEARNIAPRQLAEFGKDFAVEGLVEDYPVHPGAIKYYKEIGIWED